MVLYYIEEEKEDGADEEENREEHKDKMKCWLALSEQQLQEQTRSASLRSHSELQKLVSPKLRVDDTKHLKVSNTMQTWVPKPTPESI